MKLTQAQVESYFADGYLKAEGVFDPEEDLGPVIRAYEEEVDRRARTLHAEGRLSSLHEGEDFAHRLAKIAAEVPEAAQALDIYLVRHPAMFRFLCNPKLHDVVESLIGPEVMCHPCQHLRAVAPTVLTSISRTTDWHQDVGVLWPEADNHLVVTTWIPLIDVPEERGCLQVLPGSHTYGLVEHGTGAGNRVAPERFPPGAARPLPVKAGDMILFHNYVLHAAVPNVSDAIRWSMDLRWQDPAKPTGPAPLPGLHRPQPGPAGDGAASLRRVAAALGVRARRDEGRPNQPLAGHRQGADPSGAGAGRAPHSRGRTRAGGRTVTRGAAPRV
jgi:hypothetical protein